MKKKDPHPNLLISQFFWLQFIQPGYVHELPSSTNWMKLWRYITLELKQSSVWFIPNFSSNAVIKGIMGTVLLIIWKQMIRSTSGRFHKERTLQTKKH